MRSLNIQTRSPSTVRDACSTCNDCILLNEVTPSVERSGHRDALSSSATIMIAWETEAMRGHFFMVWFARPPRATKQCSSPLYAFNESVSFESRGSRQALSEVEGRVALRGTVVFKPTTLRKALHLPNGISKNCGDDNQLPGRAGEANDAVSACTSASDR